MNYGIVIQFYSFSMYTQAFFLKFSRKCADIRHQSHFFIYFPKWRHKYSTHKSMIKNNKKRGESSCVTNLLSACSLHPFNINAILIHNLFCKNMLERYKKALNIGSSSFPQDISYYIIIFRIKQTNNFHVSLLVWIKINFIVLLKCEPIRWFLFSIAGNLEKNILT